MKNKRQIKVHVLIPLHSAFILKSRRLSAYEKVLAGGQGIVYSILTRILTRMQRFSQTKKKKIR